MVTINKKFKDANKLAERSMRGPKTSVGGLKNISIPKAPTAAATPKATRAPKATFGNTQAFNKLQNSLNSRGKRATFGNAHDINKLRENIAKQQQQQAKKPRKQYTRKVEPIKAGNFGSLVKDLPENVQRDIKDIGNLIKKFNTNLDRMRKDSRYNRQQAASFKEQFYSTNSEIFDILTNDRLSDKAKTGAKAIRDAIAKYYEDNNIPYKETDMLSKKLEEIKENIERIDRLGYLKPQEFLQQHWKEVNLIDKAVTPNLSEAEAAEIRPELKKDIAERFFKMKESNKYRHLKSDEILMEAYQDVMDGEDFSDEIEQYMQETETVKQFGNTLGYDDFGDDGWL